MREQKRREFIWCGHPLRGKGNLPKGDVTP